MNLESRIVLIGTPVSIIKKVNKQTKELYLVIQFLNKNLETGEVKLFDVKVPQSYLHNFNDLKEGKQVKVEIQITTFNNTMFIKGIKLL